MDDYRQLNDSSLDELRSLASTLGDADLARAVEGNWTVAMVFAHLAFWDRLLDVRWQRALSGGIVVSHDAALAGDLLNDALEPLLPGIDGRFAIEQALVAAESINRAIAALPAEAIRSASIDGLRWSFDRSIHRREHIEQLNAALGRSAPPLRDQA